MNKNKHRNCPICQNAVKKELLHHQKFILPDNHILPREYNIVSCSNCGFVYVDTFANQHIFDKYYEEMSKYEMNYIDSDTSLFVDRALWINTFIHDKNASIIDIGCGNGQLLLELQKLRFSNLTALDPSKKCIDSIRNRGIDGIAGSIFNITPTKQYDCVILSGVLEHIIDVSNIMKSIKSLAKKNGLLFVFVPDVSRYQDYDEIPFDYFNIEHINHFDETSLINLGLLHGLSNISFLKTTILLSQVKQPVIFCVYKNEDKEITNWNNYSKNSTINYIKKTQNNKGIHLIIDELVESNEKIIVWGAGNYTTRLLATSNLCKCNIAMFVDNDKNKQGTNINGKPVCAPNNILSMQKAYTILVIVAVFHDEIIAEIKNYSINNKVIVLR